jgi:YYY domain-containing protein
MSAIVRSTTFPPNDPWLSGYSISYYYFGYVISAMFVKLSGVVTTAGYNLWTAMMFALVSLTTFGVVYNLVKARFVTPETVVAENESVSVQPTSSRGAVSAVLVGLVGVMFMVWMGNWQFPLVEYPYNQRIASADYLQFWDVNIRQQPLQPSESEITFQNWGGDWWWFRSARAMNDRNLPEMVEQGAGEREEVINEFPQFSFLLADNHPHVMALSFTLLAMALGLNILLTPRRPNRQETVFYGLVLGGLIFLNTWDAPIYLFVLLGADVLRRLRSETGLQLQNSIGSLLYGIIVLPLTAPIIWIAPETGSRIRKAFGNPDAVIEDDWLELLRFAGSLIVVMVIAYAPFIISFRSQLGGILPNIIYPTPFQQYLLTFGPLVPIIALFLLVEAWRGSADRRLNLKFGVQVALAILLVLVLALLVFMLLGALVPSIRTEVQRFADGSGGLGTLLPSIISKRLAPLNILTTILLVIGLLLVVARLFPFAGKRKTDDASVEHLPYPVSTGFALLLVGAALGLTLIPEFVYLRDVFGSRMNTIFKLYYQAWALFAIAGTYGVYSLLADARLRLPPLPVRVIAGVGMLIAVGMGLMFPVYGITSRANLAGTRVTLEDGEQGVTLDGWRTAVLTDDYVTLQCLSALVGDDQVVVAEATGGSYDSVGPSPINSGRVGAITGIPTILGWQGHQSQWRGTAYVEVVGARPDEVRRIYEDLRLDVVQPILQKYGVDYVMYGIVERSPDKYGSAGEQKFLESYEVVCESGNSRIYRVKDVALVAQP